jgi:D-alanine-D-alanine ligase
MKTRITVIMGGPSAEHEVSILTGREVLLNLNRDRYSVTAVVITRDRRFFYCDATQNVPDLRHLAAPDVSDIFNGSCDAAHSQPIWDITDIAFIAMHGEFGEDGTIQGFLETVGIPYTGSGVLASAAGMDKIASKRIFESTGIVTPPSSVYCPACPELTAEAIAAKHGFPCFVKCPQSGSSRLMGRAADIDALKKLLKELSGYSKSILVETSVKGEEFSCPVLERPDGSVSALPPIFIKPVSSDFFDYEAKYSRGASEEIVPAPCTEEIANRIKDMAVRAHLALGCRGLTRTDMILSNGNLYVLEINTLPGLTPASLAPKSFAASGGSYPELLDIIILTAGMRERPETA